jgi:hypothetical protein
MSNARVLRLLPQTDAPARTSFGSPSNWVLLVIVALVAVGLGNALRFEFEVVAPAAGAAAVTAQTACGHEGLRTQMCEVASQGGFVAILNY